MKTELVTASNIYEVVRRALGVMDEKVLLHGEITAYIFYNMLKGDRTYTEIELAEYTLVGMLHDVGMIKTGYDDIIRCETHNVWEHSIYGYLFLKYLSPVDEMAEVVLYHHLPQHLHSRIQSSQMKVAEYLTLADKMDIFMRMEGHGMDGNYFTQRADIDFSARALDAFNEAREKFSILEKLRTGEYRLELKQLFERVKFSEKHKKGFLEMLIYAIDFRSQQTVIHTISTKAFAMEIGKMMMLSASDLQIVYYGTLLHDIGKIVIPLSVLEAPRRLSDEEMEVMKTHVEYTEKILHEIFDERIVNVAAKHHEKLDGTGYPKGIKGEELSQCERIATVADILSALYGKRSYKDAFPPEKVKSILREDARSGKICKEVVDVVIANFDTIITNYETQRNDSMERYLEIVQQYESIYEKFKVYEQQGEKIREEREREEKAREERAREERIREERAKERRVREKRAQENRAQEEKLQDEFSRTSLLIGEVGLKKLKNTRVAVFGVGGVGGYVVEALARSGVGSFVLIDNDNVSVSNLNRQIIATVDTIGKPKVEVMRDRILSINPKAKVEIHQCFYLPDIAEHFNFPHYDYVVDAVDTVTAKIDIVLRAQAAKIPVISVMGAGNKMDPTKFEVTDIYKTSVCPLAKVMRKELKQRGVKKLKVVYSKEPALTPIKFNEESKGTTGRPAPGSVSFVPSVAGLIAAGEVIKDVVYSRQI